MRFSTFRNLQHFPIEIPIENHNICECFNFNYQSLCRTKKRARCILVQTSNNFRVVLAAVSHFPLQYMKILGIVGTIVQNWEELTEIVLLLVQHIFALNSNFTLIDSSVISS